MIAKIKGIIDEIKPTEVIIDVMGVGYHLHIPLSTYETIQGKDEIVLYVHTLHKEDQLSLFGFTSAREKEIFVTLLQVSGVGPVMALSILSGISIDNLVQAVKTENISLLTKIPGIGRAKAEKLVFELKRKYKKLENFVRESGEPVSVNRDAVDALASLGFDERKAYTIIEDVIKDNPDASLEQVIKEALKLLSS